LSLDVAASPDKRTIVVCSPGSPGTTDTAGPAMDAFAAALSAKAGTPLAAIYDPSEDGGVTRLQSSGLGIVSLPFFLKHQKELGLHARLGAVQKGQPALESWVLVAQKGRPKGAKALAGVTIMSDVAFAPAFVRGVATAGLGAVPANVTVVQSGTVLSALRRAANGEAVVVMLDAQQAASLGSLPFADKLEVIAKSPAMPVAVVVTIDKRVDEKTWAPIGRALLSLASDVNAAKALDSMRVARFVPIDAGALAAARKLYAGGSK
jgi:hypothetical protein